MNCLNELLLRRISVSRRVRDRLATRSCCRTRSISHTGYYGAANGSKWWRVVPAGSVRACGRVGEQRHRERTRPLVGRIGGAHCARHRGQHALAETGGRERHRTRGPGDRRTPANLRREGRAGQCGIVGAERRAGSRWRRESIGGWQPRRGLCRDRRQMRL